MNDAIAHWLTGIGMERYVPLFTANDIDATLLTRLTAQDLQTMGVASLGHRLRILDAVASHAVAAAAALPQPVPLPSRDYTPRHLRDQILQSRSAMEGERKQVSVLFADIQGSMELAAQLDPEQWHRILEGFFAILTEGVHRFEGTVNQYTGDGIMALFGAPIAHEDHAQRACFSALHLQRAITRYAIDVKREHGVGFSTRMGINSGEVVVGRIGDDLRMDYTAQGHTVGLAQRMESLAEPNACYLGPSTAALVRGYLETEDLGEFRVKGVADRVRVHRLAGPGAARTRLDVSRQRGLSRFVGRDADLRVLKDALAQAGTGSAQVVGIVADAGTGKSRLCFEFLERCRARGMRVWEGRAVAHGRNIPLLPILELFRAAFDIAPQDDARATREKIAGRVLMQDATQSDLLPLVFDLLAVGDAQHPAPAMDAQARQRRLIDLLARQLRGTDAQTPVTVVMLEDLHWLDAASAEFVEGLVDAGADTRSLLLLNFRPEFDARWMRKGCYRQVSLAPLGPEAMAELLAARLGRAPGITALAADIHLRTAGNPFFAEELAQSLIESGQLEGVPGAYRLSRPVTRLEVPATVQAVLAARIDRLSEREKRVLQDASVIGKQFAEPLLAAVTGMPPDALASALQGLCQAAFIHVQALYPAPEYAFRHPLTQEVAQGSQLREQRRQVHAAVAQALALQEAGRLDEQAALLAHHWDEAGDVLQAAQWHQRAAEWPGCADFASAHHHWQRVWTLLAARPQDPASIGRRILACTRLLTLGPRLGVDLDASRQLIEEGQALADAAGDRLARIRLMMAYGWALASAGELAVCLDKLHELVPILDTIEAPALKVAAWGNLFMVTCLAARLQEALAMVPQVRALLASAEPAGKGIGSLNTAASLDQFEGFCWAWTGRLDDALVAYETCIRQSDAVGELAVFARCHAVEAHYHQGNPQQAQERARQAQAISVQLGEPPMLAGRVHQAHGYAHLAAGRAADAIRAAQAALGLHRRVDQTSAGPSAVLLAEALLAAGDHGAALAAATEAVALCRRSLRANYEAIACGVQARALLRMSGAAGVPAAAAALDAAEALITRTGAQLLAPALASWRSELSAVPGDRRPP
jgi:class 3 adenylate cyclase/tetratricopeptide (TPR) repeat protein